MNVLILGNGDEEHAWAIWLLGQSEHRLDAAFPGFGDAALAGVPAPRDLDDALARAGVEVVIVGGPIDSRGEALRRAAAEGLAIICLHPPGDDSEAYYQVALSRDETGAVIVPDLPLRLHPGVDCCAGLSPQTSWVRFAACGSRHLASRARTSCEKRSRAPWMWFGPWWARSRP